MRKRTRGRLVIVAAALALLVASCGGGGDPGNGPTPASSAGSVGTRPASSAKLKILSPRNGDVIEGTSVLLRLGLKDARIVATTSTNLRPDEGHVHVLLDDQLVSMTFGLEQTIPDVPPGEHLIRVEFIASDHAPFDPRILAAVTFEVTP